MLRRITRAERRNEIAAELRDDSPVASTGRLLATIRTPILSQFGACLPRPKGQFEELPHVQPPSAGRFRRGPAVTRESEGDAHILLADISGYTRFLRDNKVTLRHASYIVSELLAALIGRAEAPLKPEKLEGDAVLFVASVGPDGTGETAVARSLFGFHAAFDRRRAELTATNTCPCEACTSLDRLELKVVGHFGRVLRHTVKRFEEVAGFDLIVAHRLLKNSVPASRYLLLSEAAWERLKPDRPLAVSRHVEDCEGVGAVPVVLLEGGWDELSGPPPARATLASRFADFAIKHLMLLPYAGGLARRALAAWRPRRLS